MLWRGGGPIVNVCGREAFQGPGCQEKKKSEIPIPQSNETPIDHPRDHI